MLRDTKDIFIGYISDNNYSAQRFMQIDNPLHKKLFIHYFTIPTLLKELMDLDEANRDFVIEYITAEFPLMYDRLVAYIADGRLPYSILEAPYRYIGVKFAGDVLKQMDYLFGEEPVAIDNLMKIQKKTSIYTFDYNLVKAYYLFRNADVLNVKEEKNLWGNITKLDERKTRKLLRSKFGVFRQKVIEQAVAGEVGVEYIREQTEKQLDLLERKLSLIGE